MQALWRVHANRRSAAHGDMHITDVPVECMTAETQQSFVKIYRDSESGCEGA